MGLFELATSGQPEPDKDNATKLVAEGRRVLGQIAAKAGGKTGLFAEMLSKRLMSSQVALLLLLLFAMEAEFGERPTQPSDDPNKETEPS